MGNKGNYYITTAIAYTSGKPHIGNTYEIVLADSIARFRRQEGYNVFFQTGTDEHGQKIENKANEIGVEPKEFVDNVAGQVKDIWDMMNTSYDKFIRTTDASHEAQVQKIFDKLFEQGDIYKGAYEGMYCTPCESFWTTSQLKNGKCPDCGREVQPAKEEAYFFKTNKYLDSLLKFYNDNPNFLTPVSRKNEMINTFIKPGLDDLCVSRTSFSWGIPVKENPKHVVYVWLDALTNYISALGYGSDNPELFKKYWEDEDTEIIHILGADITRFHAIYWPMFLESQGLRKPDREFIHGLLMMKDSKMSKSKGNVVDPYPLVERYGVDAVRYYLVREINFGSDGSFSPEQFVERCNADLANSYGNLLNRTISMINKYFGGTIPAYQGQKTAFDGALETMIDVTINEYEKAMDDLRITEAITFVNELVNRANKYIDETTPWALAKDESKKDELASVMNHLARAIYVASRLYHPVLVTASDKAFDQLGVKEEKRDYAHIKEKDVVDNNAVVKGDPLFPRLDAEIEVKFIAELMGTKQL